RQLIDRALAWAQPRYEQQTVLTGEPSGPHAAGMVRVLADLRADAATRAAALVAVALSAESETRSTLRNDPLVAILGPEVTRLARGFRALIRVGQVTREISEVHATADEPQAEKLRKMMLAMAADLRIVLMRLASRLQTLRWHAASKRTPDRMLALETLDLYAP